MVQEAGLKKGTSCIVARAFDGSFPGGRVVLLAGMCRDEYDSSLPHKVCVFSKHRGEYIYQHDMIGFEAKQCNGTVNSC